LATWASAWRRPAVTAFSNSGLLDIQLPMVRGATSKNSASSALVAPSRQ